jgi:hypothetical protein
MVLLQTGHHIIRLNYMWYIYYINELRLIKQFEKSKEIKIILTIISWKLNK